MKALVAVLCLLSAPSIALSQDIDEERVQFEAGTSGASITADISGDQIVDYLLGAEAGQRMEITFAPSNPSANFNLLFEDNPEALHTGPIDGTNFSGVLPNSGDYRIRVFLMRNAARRDETTTYTLDVSVGSGAAKQDIADSLAGGPDTWEVFGVGDGDNLNIRSGPSIGDAVVAQVSNGALLAFRDACVMTGDVRWCAVTTPEGTEGWAAGRFLREASAQPEITGQVPCATRIGQPMSSCDFRAVRGVPGTATIWIVLPHGGERYVEFVDGSPSATDPGLTLSVTRIPEINVLQIGDAERFEIPDVIVFGG